MLGCHLSDDVVSPPSLTELIRVVADWADGCPGVGRVFLFGSRVRGDHRPDSDLDVAIEPSTHPSSMFVRRLIQSEATDFAALVKRCSVPVHITINERRWPLLLEIMRPAVVLCDRKVFALYLPKDAFAAAARKRKAIASNPFQTVSFQVLSGHCGDGTPLRILTRSCPWHQGSDRPHGMESGHLDVCPSTVTYRKSPLSQLPSASEAAIDCDRGCRVPRVC